MTRSHYATTERIPVRTSTVSVPAYLQEQDRAFGPALIEHRTAESGLSELGTYFMRFPTDGISDPWTLQYEETIYVIEGRARLVVVEDEGERTVSGEVGDLIVIPKGATVRYGASVGTRLLLSISRVNWRDAQA
jgi:ethanolamine utilization protein EutQ (cupin superfamily)